METNKDITKIKVTFLLKHSVMPFKFPYHKYIISFLFIFVKLKHSPLSDVILRLSIFSLLILPPSAPFHCALILL